MVLEFFTQVVFTLFLFFSLKFMAQIRISQIYNQKWLPLCVLHCKIDCFSTAPFADQTLPILYNSEWPFTITVTRINGTVKFKLTPTVVENIGIWKIQLYNGQ